MYSWTPASFSPLATNDDSGNSPVFQHVLWCYVFCTLLQVVFKTLYNSFIDVVEAQIAVVDIGIKIFLVSLNAFLMIRFFCLFGICLFFVQWAVYLAIARLSWLVEVVCLLLCMYGILCLNAPYSSKSKHYLQLVAACLCLSLSFISNHAARRNLSRQVFFPLSQWTYCFL